MAISLFQSALELVLNDLDYVRDLDLKDHHLETINVARDSILAGQAAPLDSLPEFCDNAIEKAHYVFKSTYHKNISLGWRRIFTDAIIIGVCIQCQDPSASDECNFWEGVIRQLDEAIIIAGAPGEARLEIIHALIKKVQKDHLPVKSLSQRFTAFDTFINPIKSLPKSFQGITTFKNPITLSKFLSMAQTPFIIKSFASDWPAIEKWTSPEYLLRIGGLGRIVPVEVGNDYTAQDWSQKFVKWEDFLASLISGDDARCYLAQHSLLRQMPELQNDIVIPDYVYANLPAPAHFPEYIPPSNLEQLVINAWIGPRHTVSPAHTDPYFNCYVQVVGRKTIWLTPPEMSKYLCKSADYPDQALANTTTLDVFQSIDMDPRLIQEAMSAVLEPGDLLYMPPLWWHAMRSEDISASVSMWF